MEQVISALRCVSSLPKKSGGSLVIGFGSRLWKRLSPQAAPRLLRPFSTIKGRGGKSAPATQQDLWLWFHGIKAGELFDLAMQAHGVLDPLARLSVEVPGMTYGVAAT